MLALLESQPLKMNWIDKETRSISLPLYVIGQPIACLKINGVVQNEHL